MTKSNLFRQAHKLTREDAKVYVNINYRVQFGLNLKALYSKKEMENKNFSFEFEATSDPRKGTPYVAKLEINKEENKIDRKFFELDRTYGKKEVTVSGTYEAEVGDIIEQREGGSWKNDYRYWYLVTEGGKLEKVADIDNSSRKNLVTKYLKGEIKAIDLMGKW